MAGAWKNYPDERRAEENEEGSELIYDKIIFVVNVFYTQVCVCVASVMRTALSLQIPDPEGKQRPQQLQESG